MKRTLILSFVLFSSLAQAGVNLVIEHPRNPSGQKDLYQVACDKKCALMIKAINPVEGDSDVKFEANVKQLWALPLPKDVNVKANRVLYKISAVDGDKKIEFKIGHADLYKGEELVKYLDLISYIEGVKNSMRSELEAAKK